MPPLDLVPDSDPLFNGFVGRVPIYTQGLELYGYDLRVCSRQTEDNITSDNELINATEKVPIEALVGGKQGFLSVSGSLITHADDLLWPKESVVLSFSSNMFPANGTGESLRELVNIGYTVALEGQGSCVELMNYLDCSSICSVDADKSFSDLKDHVVELHQAGQMLLVKNIDTPDQYRLFKELGFDLFHGAYFERPKLLENTQISANKVAIIELLACFQDPKITIDKLEDLVSQDLTLSYKILRLINTAFFGMPKRVDSIKRAVVFFGLERLKNWASVLVFNAIDYKPRELLVTALVRAKTCEYLAENLGLENPESYYIAGMFSTLDAIMDVPMAQILERLKLTPEIEEGLLEGTGSVGELLRNVLAIETGACYKSADKLLDDGLAFRAYTHAIDWASNVNKVVNA